MIFRDWGIWFIANVMKMPQLNRKYPSEAAKRRKKEEQSWQKYKGLLDRFGTNEPTESTASSIRVVNTSYNCLVHNQIHKSWKFCKNEVDKCMI